VITPTVNRRRRTLTSAIAVAAPWLASRALGAGSDWPARPVRVVVNFPPGSSPDVLIRLVMPSVQTELGQPLVIDNRAGASGVIGATAVAKALPDGYTLLMTAGSLITTTPYVFDKIPYDTQKDLVPVAGLARLALFLVVRPGLPTADVREFLDYLRSSKGRLSYASAGNATGLHIAGEMLNGRTGAQAVHVPYKGAALALQGLLAGDVDFYFDPGIALEHVRANRLRLLAVASLRRSSLFPDVPTLHEVGLTGFDAGTTHGLYAPAGLPPEIAARVNAAVNTALRSADVMQQIKAMGAEPAATTVQAFAEQMADDAKRYAQIVKERGIRGE